MGNGIGGAGPWVTKKLATNRKSVASSSYSEPGEGAALTTLPGSR